MSRSGWYLSSSQADVDSADLRTAPREPALQKTDCDSKIKVLDVVTFQIFRFLVLKSTVSLDVGCLELEMCGTHRNTVL